MSTMQDAAASSPAAARPRPTGGRFLGLDGLRALAIVCVFVFHLYPGWLPGGFLGVDVFFVISGFLITSLLLREHATKGRIDFKSFWLRRARRLLPALVLCVTVSSLVARAVNPDLVVGLPRQVLGAATFSTNWVEIFSGASYFDQTAPTLFMNFWSLAVEEQFYLIWPVLCFLLIRAAAPRVRLAVAAVAAVASTAAMAWLYVPDSDATRVYYGTDTHIMGLMVGAGLAFAWASPWHAPLARWAAQARQWSGPVAIGVLLVGMSLLSEESPVTFRGGIALASLVTGLLVVATVARFDERGQALPQSAWQRILDAPAATWVGERSYGLYLWHWPVILVLDQLWPTAPGTWPFALRTVAILAVTGIIAEASFRWVEMPVRKHGFRKSWAALTGWLRTLPTPRARAVTASSLVTGLALAATIATAPVQSATAEVLQRNEAAAQNGGTPGAPAAGGSVGPTAGSTPSASIAIKPGNWAMPAGNEIDGFGDSMMVGSVPALQLYFPDIRLDAHSNRHLDEGIALIKARGGDVRRAVVLNFGMNAGVKPEELKEALDLLGPDRMVVVVNLYGTFARVKTDNAAIEEAVKGRPNVVIADWKGTVESNPGVLQADKKHPSLRGSHLYAQCVQRAFADLTERNTGKHPETKTYPMPR